MRGVNGLRVVASALPSVLVPTPASEATWPGVVKGWVEAVEPYELCRTYELGQAGRAERDSVDVRPPGLLLSGPSRSNVSNAGRTGPRIQSSIHDLIGRNLG